MSLDGTDITIIGAGIGGLAAAIALARRGARITVLERAVEITEVGAGVQISPNGMAVLRALGLGDNVLSKGLRNSAVVLRDGSSDRLLLRMDVRTNDYVLIHRAALIGVLETAARRTGVDLRLGCDVRQVTLGRTPVVTDADGNRYDMDILIGADGIRSATRAVLNGRAEPQFTGQVAWRAIAPAANLLNTPPMATVHMGPRRHLVSYPLDRRRMNIVAVEERGEWSPEGWHHSDDPENLRSAFAGFAPAVQDLLGRVEVCHLWGLFRHPVAETWSKDGIFLLGDAAHPTLPFLAQGANLALEDAWVLADRLASGAANTYQSARKPRVTRAIAAAEANARNYHLSGMRRAAAHLVLRAVPPGLMLRRLDWLYGHDVTRS